MTGLDSSDIDRMIEDRAENANAGAPPLQSDQPRKDADPKILTSADSSDSSSSSVSDDDSAHRRHRRRSRNSRSRSHRSSSSRHRRRRRHGSSSRSRSRSRSHRHRSPVRSRSRHDQDSRRPYDGRRASEGTRGFRDDGYRKYGRTRGYSGDAGSRKPSPKPNKPLTVEDIVRKEQEQIDRDQRTVFASQIHPKVALREVFEFFSQVGKVRDVQCIQDQRTRKFKGMAYIEMDSVESIPLALALNGHHLKGYPVAVQLTQAEKNRAAAQSASAAQAAMEQAARVQVTSLHPDLKDEDLRSLFEPFGRVDNVHVDRGSGTATNSAWITYHRASDAQNAASELNQMDLLGHMITVTMELPLSISMSSSSFQGGSGSYGQLGELDDDAGGGLHLSAQSRIALMQRLQRSQAEPVVASRAAPAPQAHPSIPRIQETTCLVLKNMFTRSECEQDPDLALDIKEDVEEEAKKHGTLLHIEVDKDSDGHVFLRYTSVDAARSALCSFHNRWFASRQIQAEFVVEPAYESRFPASRR